MAIAVDKQKADELEYYTDLESLEVRFDEIRHDEYMDCSDESLVEQDYLDTMEFCLELEANEIIDDEFINLARAVYINNDERSKIKRNINIIYKSDIIEEKSYK